MVPIEDQQSDSLRENVCKSCSRPTKSEVKCKYCRAAFHPSCAVRIAGMKVIGFNELCCPKCYETSESDDANGAEISYQQLAKTNDTLNTVILKLMANQDALKGDLSEIQERLQDFTDFLVSRQNGKDEVSGIISKFDKKVGSMYRKFDDIAATAKNVGAHGRNETTSGMNDAGLGNMNVISTIGADERPQKNTDSAKFQTIQTRQSRKTDSNGAHAQSQLNLKPKVNNVSQIQIRKMAEVIGLENDLSNLKTMAANADVDIDGQTRKLSDQIGEEGFLEVGNNRRKNRRRTKVNIGTAKPEGDASEGFVAFKRKNATEERRLWLFISRARSDVTEDQVKKYVAENGKTLESQIQVRTLQMKLNSSNNGSENKCFMLGVPLHLEKQIYDAAFWPAGIGFSRFDFKLGRRFLDQSPKA